LKWGEHAHAFTVAHSVKAGVVDEIHGLLNKALADGQSFEDFKKGMLAMMEKSGWYGREDKTKDDKSYINWRIRVIYDTNMRTAHAAARYRKQLQSAESRPIWVYKSKLAGKNRRQEHIALHNKAFRYDDPFWNVYYPPNGWECKCFVDTRSEAGADRDKIPVLSSDAAGNPPAVDGVDWGKMSDDTWKYNVGREALAPNFAKYTRLPKDTLKQIYANYHKSVNGTRLTEGEYVTLATQTNNIDYKANGVQYQIGNIDMPLYEKLRKEIAGFVDSKIMATNHALWHSTGHKLKRIDAAKKKNASPQEIKQMENQLIDKKDYKSVYDNLQTPELIYVDRQTNVKEQAVVLHFVKKMGNGKVIKIVLRAGFDSQTNTYRTLELVTMEIVNEADYQNSRFTEIRR
jgi:hypothetical protein